MKTVKYLLKINKVITVENKTKNNPYIFISWKNKCNFTRKKMHYALKETILSKFYMVISIQAEKEKKNHREVDVV